MRNPCTFLMFHATKVFDFCLPRKPTARAFPWPLKSVESWFLGYLTKEVNSVYQVETTKYFRKQPNNLQIKLKNKIYVAQSGFV